MDNITVNKLRGVMDSPNKIRNVAIIGSLDHGKSSLTDTLVKKAGIKESSLSNDFHYFTDTREDEQLRGISIKSTPISLPYEYKSKGRETQQYLINVIDTPGHTEFTSEVSAALRLTDGALVVVDAVSGLNFQSEVVIKKALEELIKPIMMINKVDRLLLELQEGPEECYQIFNNLLESINVIIKTYNNEGELYLSPEFGTVAFGSSIHGWGFTLHKFAEMYAQKFGTSKEKLMNKLWGDWFWNPTLKQFENNSNEGTLKRTFCQFILEPIIAIISATVGEESDNLEKILKGLNITLSDDESNLVGKRLMKLILQKFLPEGDALLQMMVVHLPSPVEAQAYRYKLFYSGPSDDKYAKSMAACNKKGPLIMYVSKMIPSTNSDFTAFGRVFSGTVESGSKIRIMSKKGKYLITNIEQVTMVIGGKEFSIDSAPSGSFAGLTGVDQYIHKTATIVDGETQDCQPLSSFKLSLSPIIQMTVEPKNHQDLPILVEGLKKLGTSDQLVEITQSSTGEYIVGGAGELHMDICISDLKKLTTLDIKVGQPVVSIRETVLEKSDRMCMSMSPNSHNRLYMNAQPLSEKLVQSIEDASAINSNMDDRVCETYLKRNFSNNWGEKANKIWCFGPEKCGPNVVVDMSKNVQNINEIKDSVVASFQWVAKEGVLCNEMMRGVRMNILDASLHSDAIHRGAGQIITTARRVFYSSQLTASPRLQEPIFLYEIECPSSVLSKVYNAIIKKRGKILEEIHGLATINVRAHIPVVESIGFSSYLRAETRSLAFPQCIFNHYSTMDSDPLEINSKAYQYVMDTRTRKGLKVELPYL